MVSISVPKRCSADVAICVPVRDEARNLPGFLKAVDKQRCSHRIMLAIVFDGNGDDGRVIVDDWAKNVARIRVAVRTIARLHVPDAGRARAAAMALGIENLTSDGILLTTDADSRPASDWAASNCAALNAADVVCGRIERRGPDTDPQRTRLEQYLMRLHAVRRTIDPIPHDPLPSHPHTGGASIACTVGAYHAAGGMPLLASGEDRAFVEAARRAGLRVRHDPAVRVATSARHHGRAIGGLADALRQGRIDTAAGRPAIVEHPDDAAARYRLQALARAAYGRDDAAMDLARTLARDPAEVAELMRRAPSADAFVLDLIPDRVEDSRPVPLDIATIELGRHERALADRAA